MIDAAQLVARNDRVIIRREPDEQPSKTIMLTDAPRSLRGTVLSVGPGKWIVGTWWHFSQPKPYWQWIPGHREEHLLKPGMTVLFNSKWNDFGARDFAHKLPVGMPEDLHLVQIADVLCIVDKPVSAHSLERKKQDIVPNFQPLAEGLKEHGILPRDRKREI